MIRSYNREVEYALQLQDLDLEETIHRLGGGKIDGLILSTDAFGDLAMECAYRSAFLHVDDLDGHDPDYVNKLVRSKVDAGMPEAMELIDYGNLMAMTRLPSYLQLMQEGQHIYLASPAMEDAILEDDTDITGDPFAGRAYEILFRHPAICKMMHSAIAAARGDNTMDGAVLRDATASLTLTTHANAEGGTYRLFDLNLFMPKWRGGVNRGTSLIVDLDFLEENGLESAIIASLAKGKHYLDAKGVSCFVDLSRTLLKASQMIASQEVTIMDPIHPRKILAARVADQSLPQKQRKQAAALKKLAPDSPIQAVLMEGEARLKLKDFLPKPAPKRTPWTPGIEYQETVSLPSDPRARNLHGQMHPQKIKKIFQGLGERKVDLQDAWLDAQRTIMDFMTGEESPAFGSEGVAGDKFSIDLTPITADVAKPLMTIYQAALLSVDRDDRPEGLDLMQGVFYLHDALYRYRLSGNQCFLLNGEVEKMMSRTDVADISMDEIRLPYSSLYLTFENPITMSIDGEACRFEGAYLSGNNSELSVLMIMAPEEPQGKTFVDMRPPFKIRLPRDPETTLEEAILSAIETGGYDLDDGGPAVPKEALADIAADMGSFVVEREDTAQSRIAARNDKNFSTMVDALTIVANSIMVMTAGPEEIEVQETWAGVSDKTRHLLGSTSTKGRNRGRHAAQRENAMPIRVIALTNEARARRQEQESEVRKSPEEAYWRSGHWRRQAYGKGRALRRWRWIEPVLCNADAELRRAGSVYVAEVEDSGMEP